MIDTIHSSFTSLQNIYFTSSSQTSSCPSSSLPLSQSPRIFSLSSLCVWRASVNIDKIQLILADDKEDLIANNLQSALMNYGNHVYERGGFARVTHTVERLTIQRFAYFGIDSEISRKILQTLCGIVEEILSQKDDRSKFHLMIQNEVNALVRRLELTQYCLPIVALCCYGIHLSDYSFTYDYRRALQIEEILLFDHQCNPICHLFADSQGHYENLSILSKVKASKPSGTSGSFRTTGTSGTPQDRKRNQIGSKKKSSQRQVTAGESIAKKLEASSLASYCAISLVSTSQDANFGWGIGGYQVNVLYDQFLPSHYLPSKANDISFQVKNIDVLLSSNGIPKIIQTIVPLMLVVYKNFLINFIQNDLNTSSAAPNLPPLDSTENPHHPPPPPLPPMKLNFMFSFDCAHFVLALDQNYLTELSFTEANLSSRATATTTVTGQQTNNPLPPPPPPNSNRTWRLSLDLCEIHDLSPSGSTHPSILTKDPGISSPMIHVTLTELEEKTDVSLLFTGLRFCILYRYLLEVMIFTTTHFTNCITSELTKFFHAIQKTTSSDDDSEGVGGSMSPSAAADHDNDENHSLGDDEDEEIEIGKFHSQRKFHGGFFEYPDYGTGHVEEKGELLTTKQMRGSLNMFGVENLKLQRSRKSDMIAPSLYSPPPHHRSDSHSEPHIPSQKRNIWTIQFRQSTLFFPRNSASDDLLGVTIRHVNFFHKSRQVSWPDPPQEFKLFDPREILYFNFYKNEWTKGFAQEGGGGGGESEEETHMLETKKLLLSKRKISVDTEPDMEFYSASEGDESDFDEFQDAVSEPISHRKEFHPTHSSTEPQQKFIDDDDEADLPIGRYIFEMDGVDFFSSISGPYEVQGHQINPIQTSHRRFQSIHENKPVYSIITSKRLTSWSQQCWKRLSVCSSNILLVVEMTSLTMRTLISETHKPSSINFQLSMSDLYLLMSIYYDNLNEMSHICAEAAGAAGTAGGGVGTNHDSSNEHPPSPSHHQFVEPPEYGTEEFCQYVHSILSTTDVLIVRSDLQLNCSLDHPDNSYFSRNIPNFNYLFEPPLPPPPPGESFSYPDVLEFPFATIRLQWLVISCRMNLDVLQVAIGAAEGEVTDRRRSHHEINGKQFLKFYPRSSSEFNGKRQRIFDHGFANFDFGLKDSPQSIRTPAATGAGVPARNIQPFQITYFCVGYSWSLCNIGSDAPDFDFQNLNLIWLLSDYFSLYFSYPEFGNSSLSPRKAYEPTLFQYFGIDTRVFITRPHLQTSKNLILLPMETLILEAEKGIYYRYVYDSDNSVKMELDISDLSLVLMKQYRPPALSRGIRGVAGSGKQIRTLLEFGSIQFQSHLDAKETTLDYILRIGPEIHEKPLSEESEERPIIPSRSFVDFGKEFLFLSSVSLPPPKCVSPLYIPPRIFPKQSCRIATSYEDILVTVDLIMSCIGLGTEQTQTKPSQVRTTSDALIKLTDDC
jgi:hypothetical protein